MKIRIIPFLAAVLLALAGAAQATPVLYAATGAGGGTGTLGTINTTTGVFTAIGAITDASGANYSLTGLAFDSVSGILYGSTNNRSTAAGSLISINTSTGAATLIGSYGFSGQTMADLTFTSGTMYGWLEASADDLHTINTATGAAASVGNSGLSTYGAGLAADSTGTIYFAGSGNAGALRTINTTTGAPTTVATLSGAPNTDGNPISAMAFDALDTLYGITFDFGGGGNPFLITIDTTTGAITSVGATGTNGVDAIAFAPAVRMPEPATLGLLGFGLMLVGWRRLVRA